MVILLTSKAAELCLVSTKVQKKCSPKPFLYYLMFSAFFYKRNPIAVYLVSFLAKMGRVYCSLVLSFLLYVVVVAIICTKRQFLLLYKFWYFFLQRCLRCYVGTSGKKRIFLLNRSFRIEWFPQSWNFSGKTLKILAKTLVKNLTKKLHMKTFKNRDNVCGDNCVIISWFLWTISDLLIRVWSREITSERTTQRRE